MMLQGVSLTKRWRQKPARRRPLHFHNNALNALIPPFAERKGRGTLFCLWDGLACSCRKDGPPAWIALKKVNENTIVETRKRYGKMLAVNEMTVQGNTMKVISKNTDGNTMISFTAERW